MRVGIYTICKNEEKTIARMLNSVLEADEIVVVDTGSSDRTVDIIRQMAEEHQNIRLLEGYISPWRFDDAKNMALSCLSLNIDVCISLDADELMSDGWLQILTDHYDPSITRYYHSFMTEWENGSVSKHYHERIHTRKEYKWSSPVHEFLEFKAPGEQTVKMVEELLMIQRPDESKNRSSYYDLLKIAVAEHPTMWRLHTFLALEHLARKEYNEAINEYFVALETEDADKSYIYNCLARLYFGINNRDRAAEFSLKAAETDNIREYWILASQFALTDEKAEYYYSKAMSITEITKGYKYDETVWI